MYERGQPRQERLSTRKGQEMHIGYVPFKTVSINDILWIQNAMRVMSKRIRVKGPSPIRTLTECAICKNLAFVELHHVRPVWSFSVEVILENSPTSLRDLGALTRSICYGDFDHLIDAVHSELIPLCPHCHDSETIRSNSDWKDILSEKYPLLWSYRFELDDFREVLGRFYSEIKSC